MEIKIYTLFLPGYLKAQSNGLYSNQGFWESASRDPKPGTYPKP